jgi:hypothetical protein
MSCKRHFCHKQKKQYLLSSMGWSTSGLFPDARELGRLNGWLSANDIRELENMNRFKKDQGGTSPGQWINEERKCPEDKNKEEKV